MATTYAGPRNWKHIAFLVLRILLALMFAAAALFKLSGAKAAVAEFDAVGFGQWFRYFTAAVELSGAVLLLLPGKTFYGAVLLAGICAGAFIAQSQVLHGDVIHTIVLGTIFVAIAWHHRGQLDGAKVA